VRKVVSIALFGDPEKYGVYLSTFVLAHHNVFPRAEGWGLAVHVDERAAESAHGAFLKRIEARGLASVHVMGATPARTKGMAWRLRPIFDNDVGYAFCRDLDALPMPRDRAACEQFMRSGCITHTIHDNVAHAGIMGGLCGFHAPLLKDWTGLTSLDQFFATAERFKPAWDEHGTDQIVLNRLFTSPNAPPICQHHYGGWLEGRATGKVRPPEQYACGGRAAPTPDVGMSPLSPSLTAHADRLANHLGSAGYDHRTARNFFSFAGNAMLAREVLG
jgi:hypothetical protein